MPHQGRHAGAFRQDAGRRRAGSGHADILLGHDGAGKGRHRPHDFPEPAGTGLEQQGLRAGGFLRQPGHGKHAQGLKLLHHPAPDAARQPGKRLPDGPGRPQQDAAMPRGAEEAGTPDGGFS